MATVHDKTAPIRFHKAMMAFGITQANVIAECGNGYEYIFISPTEFQFGLVGDLPTNYAIGV